MKIYHRSLELLRVSPQEWRNLQDAPSSPRKYSAFSAWQGSIRRYHSSQGDQQAAINYLEGQFDKHFKANMTNERRLVEYTNYILEYCQDFEQLGHVCNELGSKLDFQLENDVILAGTIFRFDLVLSGGYSAFLLKRDDSDWQSELRMPLIQGYFADKLNVPLHQVSVGVYDVVQYSARTVSRAKEEIRLLLARVSGAR